MLLGIRFGLGFGAPVSGGSPILLASLAASGFPFLPRRRPDLDLLLSVLARLASSLPFRTRVHTLAYTNTHKHRRRKQHNKTQHVMSSVGERCSEMQQWAKDELTNEERWKANKGLAKAAGMFLATVVFSRFFGELMAI